MKAVRRHGEPALVWHTRRIACGLGIRSDPTPTIGIVGPHASKADLPHDPASIAKSLRNHATALRTTAAQMRASGVTKDAPGMDKLVQDLLDAEDEPIGRMSASRNLKADEGAHVMDTVRATTEIDGETVVRHCAAATRGALIGPNALESLAEQDEAIADALVDPRSYALGAATIARMEACVPMAAALSGLARSSLASITAPTMRSTYAHSMRPIRAHPNGDAARIVHVSDDTAAVATIIPLRDCLPAGPDEPWPSVISIGTKEDDTRMIMIGQAWIFIKPETDPVEIMRAIAHHDDGHST